MNAVEISKNRSIGAGHPAYIIAEIGINHNGSLDLAKQLISEAARAGCDAVKFQKRTPELCVPKDQWEKQRDTPWGRMSYIDYKRKTEFGQAEYTAIDDYCRA
ncbi:N-acetylneuraminate synthase family protein, partial [Hymenobacter terricola]|uniref:N-acetylneuraminate synthase family protein n=1 Tax=Hymenobacter terricola TaxID=2819236 RepID=UPI001CF33B64